MLRVEAVGLLMTLFHRERHTMLHYLQTDTFLAYTKTLGLLKGDINELRRNLGERLYQ